MIGKLSTFTNRPYLTLLLADLKSQINGLESRLKYTKRDKESMESQSLAFNARELDIITHKLQEIEPDIERLTASIATREETIEKVPTLIFVLFTFVNLRRILSEFVELK